MAVFEFAKRGFNFSFFRGS